MNSNLVNNDFFVDFDNPAICDSEGNPLTDQQAAFFSSSKCVDEEGLLYKVYRAGSKTYDVFDKNRIGSGAGSIFGKGFYFCCDRDSVKIYGNIVREYYLNLRRPYRYEIVDFDEDAIYNIETFIKVLERNRFKVTPELKQRMQEDIFENAGGLDTLINMTCGADKATEFFKTCGYDGIMNLDTLDFVAFEPNQIKLCANKAPTNSERLTAGLKKDKHR